MSLSPSQVLKNDAALPVKSKFDDLSYDALLKEKERILDNFPDLKLYDLKSIASIIANTRKLEIGGNKSRRETFIAFIRAHWSSDLKSVKSTKSVATGSSYLHV